MCEGKTPPPANSQETEATKKKKSSLGRCLKAPYRLLLLARDIYVKTLCGCADAGQARKPGGGFTAGVAVLMPRARSGSAFDRSNTFGSGDNDIMDLIRASSKRSAAAPEAGTAAVQRCQSAALTIGRIDEEHSVDFDGDVKLAMGPRSQSFVVVAGGKIDRVMA